MNNRTKRKGLWVATTLLFIASGSVILWAFSSPESQAKSITKNRRNNNVMQKTSALPTLAAFRPLMNLQLQKEIYDPPPVKIVKRTAPPLAAKLTGTAVDPNDTSKSLAFFSVRGKTVMSGIGEKVGISPNLAEILEISEDSVKVKYDNKTIELKIPE